VRHIVHISGRNNVHGPLHVLWLVHRVSLLMLPLLARLHVVRRQSATGGSAVRPRSCTVHGRLVASARRVAAWVRTLQVDAVDRVRDTCWSQPTCPRGRRECVA
jgi:hypothetical protein